MADRSFPPPYEKLPYPKVSEDLLAFMTRVVGRLNDWEDVDVQFAAPATPYAAHHQLARVPSSFEVIWADAATSVFADMASGWGYDVVYFQASAAARVRIRLR